MNDEVPDGSVSTLPVLYSDNDCSVDIIRNNFLVPVIINIYDNNSNPGGIKKSDVCIDDEANQSFMNFCMTINLHSGAADMIQVLGTLDTAMSLQVDLIGDFASETEVI